MLSVEHLEDNVPQVLPIIAPELHNITSHRDQLRTAVGDKTEASAGYFMHMPPQVPLASARFV